MSHRTSSAVFAMLLALAAAVFAGGGQESSAAKTAEPVRLKIAWWGSQTRVNNFTKVCGMYEETHPNVKFDPVFTGFDAYWQKMAAEVAGGSPPDIMMQDYTYIAQYVSKKLLADLTKYRGNLLDLSEVSENAISGGKLSGGLYGVPIGLNADSSFLYNPEILAKAGLQPPKPDWTWQDLVTMTNQVHQKLGIYGMGQVTESIGYKSLNMYLREFGSALFSEDGSKLGYANDKLVADYLQTLLTLQNSGAMAPIDTWSQHNNQQTFLISLKEAAFQVVSSNAIVVCSQTAGTTLELAFFPGPNNKAAQYVKPSSFWTASSTTKDPKNAVGFISFFTNDVAAQKVVNAEVGVPISAKIRAAMRSALTPPVQAQFDFMDRLVNYSSPIDPPPPPRGNEVQNALTTVTQEVLYKQTSPADAALKFRKQAEAILARK